MSEQRYQSNISDMRPRLVKKGSGVANGGEPPNDGGMESRVAKLETNVESIVEILRDMKQDARDARKDMGDLRNNQERDFRILFGAIITTALGLAGLMAKGFNWL